MIRVELFGPWIVPPRFRLLQDGGGGGCQRRPGGLEASPAVGGEEAGTLRAERGDAPEPSLPSSPPLPAPREKPSETLPAQAVAPARGSAPERSSVSFARKLLSPSAWRVD